MKNACQALYAAALAVGIVQVPAHAGPRRETPVASDYRARLPQDEVIYFLLPDRFENGDPANDRGGMSGGPLVTGYDPAAKGFYHGGDLRGIIRRLDYIQALGATAIWIGPIFRNKPVQGPKGQESAGYHGYWITDFTHVDPHFGSDGDFWALVDAAHARGLKVYMDIVVNHTADVIRYRECGGATPCTYRDRADYPYSRRGGVTGAAINSGFAGDAVQTAENFAKLTDPTYAYTPYVPPEEKDAKVPAWLNDVTLYHNRGDSTFKGESSTMGDFVGLDDLMTENPRVVAGMIDIFGGWIDRFGIDGFRIDTAQHVNPEFWQRFVPAMQARARARGIPNFAIFGEVSTAEMDPAKLAVHTRVDGLPATLDFAFARAVADVTRGVAGPEEMARLFFDDPLYQGGAAAALIQPTFLGNHDIGRIAMMLRKADPALPADQILSRDLLAHAMLLTLRGVPTIYSGDEQGFAGTGGDQDARQDMFASRVASYNADTLVGSTATTATASFRRDNPLFRAIAALSRLRTGHAALTRGLQVIRAADEKPGLLAVSRFDPADGHEILLVFNTSAQPLSRQVQVDVASGRFAALAGPCAAVASAPGSVAVALPAFGYAICEAQR